MLYFSTVPSVHKMATTTKVSISTANLITPTTFVSSKQRLLPTHFVSLSYTRKSIKRFFKRFLEAHATIRSCRNCVAVHIISFHMTSLIICYAIDSKHFGNTRIIYLLRLCSPSTVARLIIAVIIYTINRVFFSRLFTHINEKMCKTIASFKPSITNLNTSTTIAFIMVVLFGITSFSHTSIAIILVPIICCLYTILIRHIKFSYIYNSMLLQLGEWLKLKKEYNEVGRG